MGEGIELLRAREQDNKEVLQALLDKYGITIDDAKVISKTYQDCVSKGFEIAGEILQRQAELAGANIVTKK